MAETLHSTNHEDPTNSDNHQSDPLLKPGTFIDLTEPVAAPSTPTHTPGSAGSEPRALTDVPDWLPPGWRLVERVRTSGASAGHVDKYYMDPLSNRRFRSKKEVLFYLETGSIKTKKNAEFDAHNTPSTNSKPPKRKKSDSTAIALKNFNFDEVPAKVKWALTDVYEGSWWPFVNGVEKVLDSSTHDWSAVFSYLTLHNGGRTFL